MSTPEFQVVQREMAPKLAAFNDKITQNEALFKRIEAVYNSPRKTKLTPEQQRLAWVYYTNFVRAGAQAGCRKQDSAVGDQSTTRRPVHEIQPEPAWRRRRSVRHAEDRS